MIFTQGSEHSAVLDACVLVPASLCDILLRLAEEPAMYRPLWSEQIISEMARAMKVKLHRSATEVNYRRQQMNKAFPEALVTVPEALVRTIDCIPDEGDKHVLAAAILARADTIVTQNTKHFPKDCLERYGVLCQTADDFLIHQYHLGEHLVLDKIDDQGAGIAKDRTYVIASLRKSVPGFAQLLEERLP